MYISMSHLHIDELFWYYYCTANYAFIIQMLRSSRILNELLPVQQIKRGRRISSIMY